FIVLSNVIAVSLSVAAFLFRSPELVALFQLVLLLIAVLLTFLLEKNSKKFSHTRLLYFSMLAFWLINVFIINPDRLIPFEFKTALYLLSIITFFIVYYRVSKWIR
ncbi:MAG: hypothetical protein V1659_05535, partial [Candidatus Woesearchaeota archaeon]